MGGKTKKKKKDKGEREKQKGKGGRISKLCYKTNSKYFHLTPPPLNNPMSCLVTEIFSKYTFAVGEGLEGLSTVDACAQMWLHVLLLVSLAKLKHYLLQIEIPARKELSASLSGHIPLLKESCCCCC